MLDIFLCSDCGGCKDELIPIGCTACTCPPECECTDECSVCGGCKDEVVPEGCEPCTCPPECECTDECSVCGGCKDEDDSYKSVSDGDECQKCICCIHPFKCPICTKCLPADVVNIGNCDMCDCPKPPEDHIDFCESGATVLNSFMEWFKYICKTMLIYDSNHTDVFNIVSTKMVNTDKCFPGGSAGTGGAYVNGGAYIQGKSVTWGFRYNEILEERNEYLDFGTSDEGGKYRALLTNGGVTGRAGYTLVFEDPDQRDLFTESIPCFNH